MLAGRWSVDRENGFPADAHDAGRWAVDWQKAFKLMRMMLAAGRWIGKVFLADAHDAGPWAVN